jgi:hypothetical protein
LFGHCTTQEFFNRAPAGIVSGMAAAECDASAELQVAAPIVKQCLARSRSIESFRFFTIEIV